ncbi:hypothetical protein ATANTOWER_005967 [Ataeniobius toweri]|uniref:Uncharacterized protein n=1 Tax=Ataeniobius toweri TaxID=208326 RepID=A0ABU7A603_9TELE|nr:hypothetical protein [Ataeniobius toweri]
MLLKGQSRRWPIFHRSIHCLPHIQDQVTGGNRSSLSSSTLSNSFWRIPRNLFVVSPVSFVSGLENFPMESFSGGIVQMPGPPQPAPYVAEEQLLFSELPPSPR